MNKKNYTGVDIDKKTIDKWIERMKKEPELDYITSGSKYIFKDRDLNQLYICKIEQVVDLEKEDSEDYGTSILEAAFVDWAKQEDKTIIAKYDLYNEQNVAGFKKQEVLIAGGFRHGKTKLFNEIMEIAKKTNTPVWTASQKQNPCTRCGLSIDNASAFVGDGDGTGQRFAHYDCYFPEKKEVKKCACGHTQQHHINNREACGAIIDSGMCCSCEWYAVTKETKVCKECKNNPVGEFLFWADCCRSCFNKAMNSGNGKPKEEMKCSGCRADLPLGSGRYHYDTGDITVPCTHNPITGEAYPEAQQSVFEPIPPMPDTYKKHIDELAELAKKAFAIPEDFVLPGEKEMDNKMRGIIYAQPMPAGAKLIFDGNPELKCECGGQKCKTTCADWCPKGGTK